MRVFVLALLVMAIPVTTQAQDRQAAAQANIDVHNFQDQFGQALRTNALEQQMDNSRATQNPRVLRRAQEAADLINRGDCAGARSLAQRANDTRLLAGITQVCSTAAAPPAPATAPTGH